MQEDVVHLSQKGPAQKWCSQQDHGWCGYHKPDILVGKKCSGAFSKKGPGGYKKKKQPGQQVKNIPIGKN
jgi:hypothetical protein